MVTAALLTLSLPAFPAGAQQGVVGDLRANPKLHAPGDILADFANGGTQTAVIVLLRPTAAATELAARSRESARVPAEFSAQDAPAYFNLQDESIRTQLQATVTETVNRVILQLGAAGMTVTQRFSYQFGFSARVTPAALERIVNSPEVISVEKDALLQPHLAQGIPLMNAAAARSTYTGAGVSIAICDTGIDVSHPRLGGTSTFPNAKVIGGYDFGDNNADPRPGPTGEAHGTACAGIAAGDTGTVGDYIGGVAPGAKLYAVKISAGTGGSATSSAMIAGWEWCVTHKNDDPANPILVISTSFGGGLFTASCNSYNSGMTTAAANAVAAGITLFASSGNDGSCTSVAWPACISYVNSVGAVFDAALGTLGFCLDPAVSCAPATADARCSSGYLSWNTTAADKVTSYSNSASFLTLFAPSHNAYTADIVGTGGYSTGDYSTTFGGTSAACPYAAGSAAVLQSAAKAKNGSFLTPAQVKSYLVGNGDDVTDGKVAITKPRINLGRAVAALPAVTVTSATSTTANGQYKAGAAINVTVNFSEAVSSTGLVIDLNSGGSVSTGALSSVASYSGTYTVGAGQTSPDLSVSAVTGTITNAAAVATVNPTVPAGQNIADAKAIVIDTTAPTVALGTPSPSVTDAGPVTYEVTYADTNFSASTLAVGDVTLNRTGTADGTVSVSGSGTTRAVTISDITGDGTLGISLAAGTGVDVAGNAAAAAGPSTTFLVDNTTPFVRFTQAASGVLETTTPAAIAVSLSTASALTVTVDYATANGSATAGSDYTATSGTLTFAPGVTTQTIQVPILNDTTQEPDETFSVTLTSPANAQLGAIATHTVLIYDEAVPGLAGLNVIANAVDQEAMKFKTTVGAGWWWQFAVTHDGSDAARSAIIADDQASSFQTTGSFGAGSVSFWWKVSSQAGADYLSFSIDGAVKDAIAGEIDWEQKSYPVTAGVHTLKWEYAKDGGGAGGIDAAWVDQLVLPVALMLWTRRDTGEAILGSAQVGAAPDALAAGGLRPLAAPSGEGGPWEATSCAHADASTDYVLWSRGDTGQAILAKVAVAAPAGSLPVASWAYLKTPAGVGGPWQATSYAHVGAAEGYVLWTRGDTGQAILWKVVPGDVSGTIPVASWAYLKTPGGVGAHWRATSYTHVDAATGYVLWTRSDTGQAVLWKIAPGAVSGTIPVTSWAYLKTPAGVGGPWQATSYTHIDAAEGYVLWTRGNTGRAVLWQVAPGAVSGVVPVKSWKRVSSSEAAGRPWRAAGYVHGATPAVPAARGAAALDAVDAGARQEQTPRAVLEQP